MYVNCNIYWHNLHGIKIDRCHIIILYGAFVPIILVVFNQGLKEKVLLRKKKEEKKALIKLVSFQKALFDWVQCDNMSTRHLPAWSHLRSLHCGSTLSVQAIWWALTEVSPSVARPCTTSLVPLPELPVCANLRHHSWHSNTDHISQPLAQKSFLSAAILQLWGKSLGPYMALRKPFQTSYAPTSLRF